MNYKNKQAMISGGFSMLEVVFSIGFFLFLIVTISQSSVRYANINKDLSAKKAAKVAAMQVLEEFRTDDISGLPSTGSTTESVTVGNKTFSVQTYYCSTVSYCSTDARHLKAEVTYKGNIILELETVYYQMT